MMGHCSDVLARSRCREPVFHVPHDLLDPPPRGFGRLPSALILVAGVLLHLFRKFPKQTGQTGLITTLLRATPLAARSRNWMGIRNPSEGEANEHHKVRPLNVLGHGWSKEGWVGFGQPIQEMAVLGSYKEKRLIRTKNKPSFTMKTPGPPAMILDILPVNASVALRLLAVEGGLPESSTLACFGALAFGFEAAGAVLRALPGRSGCRPTTKPPGHLAKSRSYITHLYWYFFCPRDTTGSLLPRMLLDGTISPGAIIADTARQC